MNKYELEVYNALRELEIPAHLRGYEFIKSAVEIINNDPTAIHSVIKLYEKVGKKHNSTPTKVERNIRHAIASSDADSITRKKVMGTARVM